jgi:NitT/TauT family transport system substrate-binding protein
VQTLDPTIKPEWLEALKVNHRVLTQLNLVKELDHGPWVNDTFVRQAYRELGLDYDAQLKSFTGYSVSGHDPACNTDVSNPREAGQVWLEGGDIVTFSSPACTLAGVKRYTSQAKPIGAIYLSDRALGIKLFADTAYYSLVDKAGSRIEVVPFLLKRDAEQHAAQHGGKLATYDEALAAIPTAFSNSI